MRWLALTASAFALGGAGYAFSAFGAADETVGTQTFMNVVTYTIPTVTETVTVTEPPAPPPPPVVTANVWMDTNGGTCTRSPTRVAYDDTTACGTLNATFQAEQCGDLALVKAGTYGGDSQVLRNATVAGCSSGATLRGESKAVVFQHVNFGNDPNGISTSAPHNLTFGTLTLTWGMEMNGDSVNDMIDNVDGGSIAACCTSRDLTIQNSEWGPCDTLGQSFNGQPADCRSDNLAGPGEGKNKLCCGVANVTVKGNVFHDYVFHPGGPHFECWWVAGGNNVTYDSNTFYNCQTNGVSLGDFGSDGNTSGTWYFQNNQCSNSLNEGCFKFGGLPYAATMIFRFNSFSAGRTITNEEPNSGTPTNIYVIGNVLGTSQSLGGIDCIANSTYDYNIELQGGNNQGCGQHRTIVTTLPYVNPANLPAGDYHLAPGSTPADNYVPGSAVFSGLGFDWDGQARPHDASRDAGIDER